jgi:asparagine synthase (glutamine-hydrolysing)
VSAIAGLLHFDGRPATETALAPMMRVLAALGPDRQAYWHDESIALGASLMTFLPEDVFDRQPWVARKGALAMVANARIDNRDELTFALGLDGRTMSDSEMLFHAYERWGKSGFDRVVGEFTLAAWDARERRLLCARSQLGGLPLYYHCSRRGFAFASTAGALLALPDIPPVLDERHLACTLALLPDKPQATYYRDIVCLPPGHILSVANGTVAVERYWRLDIERRVRFPSDADYAEALRETFDRAVAAQLRSIHPVGAQLSSGCDSSAVTAMAARRLATEQEQQRLTAFTAAPREGYTAWASANRTIDESAYAAEVAARLPNVTHVVLRPDRRSALDVLGRCHRLYGAPLRNPANLIWVEQILDAARERGIRVLLTGESGNRTISYDGFTLLGALFRSGHWLALAGEVRALRARGIGRSRIARATLGPSVPASVRRLRRRLSQDASPSLGYSAINPDFAAEVDIEAIAQRMRWQANLAPQGDGPTRRRAFLEAHDVGDYRNGMRAGWGIETRDPTGDRRVVELCLAIPEEQYLRHGETRSLYRRAFEPVLPTAQMLSRKRGYQAADWHEGLTAARPQIAAELDRLERSPGARRMLDLPRLRRLVANWPSGNWHHEYVTQQYRMVLMRGIAVGMFIRNAESGAS